MRALLFLLTLTGCERATAAICPKVEAPASAPVAASEPVEPSDDDLLLTKLRQRRLSLEAREAAVTAREAALAAKEAVPAEKKQETDTVGDLVAAMTPKAAARVVGAMEDPAAAALLGRMEKEQASEIFALLDPARAARIAQLLAATKKESRHARAR